LAYHRRLRARRIRDSVLDEIPGIGDKRKKALLERFGSVMRLRRATAEEIAGVPGMGLAAAREILERLRSESACVANPDTQ
jgi:excinuclease ABC subunit C